MAQQGCVWKKGKSWFLRYRLDSIIDGTVVSKMKCVWLAEVSDKYKTKGDLADLVAEKMAAVRQSARFPRSGENFVEYVEGKYLPHCTLRVNLPEGYKGKMAMSTVAGYTCYWKLYLKPHVGKYDLRDFTISIITNLLAEIASSHKLNSDTTAKVLSIMAGIFSHAIKQGDYPARSMDDNPAHGAAIPVDAPEPKQTIAATREEVQGYLAALKVKGMELERAAVAIMAYCGTSPHEALGLRWEEWNRELAHIPVLRSVVKGIVREKTKTKNRRGFVPVGAELKKILLDLWEEQGSPISGFILAARNGKKPTNLDNMSKRQIRSTLNRCEVCQGSEDDKHEGHPYKRNETLPVWHSFYALRRFVGTEVAGMSDSDTAAKTLRNTRAVAERHYIKRTDVPKEVRQVQTAFEGLAS
jgi:integrase